MPLNPKIEIRKLAFLLSIPSLTARSYSKSDAFRKWEFTLEVMVVRTTA